MFDSTSLDALDDATFEVCLKLVHELTGITIGRSRKSMVQGRLRRRVAQLQLSGYASYLELVRGNPAERPTFIDLVTTNETYCYRTPRIWQFISDEYLLKWFSRNKGRTFNAWSAAASSGEEAHTLAVLLQSFRDSHPAFVYQILGTDISQEMIGLCQRGSYAGRSIESFKNAKPDLFAKYLESQDGVSYRVKSEIKGRMRFRTHNLFEPLVPREKFDLVLIRNVLIYFTPLDQEKVMANIESRIGPESIVIIGESESLTPIKTRLKANAPLIYSLDTSNPTENLVA